MNNPQNERPTNEVRGQFWDAMSQEQQAAASAEELMARGQTTSRTNVSLGEKAVTLIDPTVRPMTK